jgi:hypothetical protein
VVIFYIIGEVKTRGKNPFPVGQIMYNDHIYGPNFTYSFGITLGIEEGQFIYITRGVKARGQSPFPVGQICLETTFIIPIPTQI